MNVPQSTRVWIEDGINVYSKSPNARQNNSNLTSECLHLTSGFCRLAGLGVSCPPAASGDFPTSTLPPFWEGASTPPVKQKAGEQSLHAMQAISQTNEMRCYSSNVVPCFVGTLAAAVCSPCLFPRPLYPTFCLLQSTPEHYPASQATDCTAMMAGLVGQTLLIDDTPLGLFCRA